jgi:phosphotransacetylase/acyl dehydratase
MDIGRRNHDVSFPCFTIAAYTLSNIATHKSQSSANSGLFDTASPSERPLGSDMGRISYGKYGMSALSFIAPHNPNLSGVIPAASETDLWRGFAFRPFPAPFAKRRKGAKLMAEMVENKTFDELQIGETVRLSRTFEHEDLATWAAVTGNANLVHAYEVAARQGREDDVGEPGMWGTALFGTMIGTQLPGIGTRIRSASIEYTQPLVLGTQVTATVTVMAKHPKDGSVILECRCVDAHGDECFTGTAEVIPPPNKIREPVRALPKIHLHREERFLELVTLCQALEPATTAVVHPCSDDALVGPIRAAERGLISPILVGPEAKIRTTAEQASIDISQYPIIPVAHSHEAAERAVAMVRAGEAELLMKGSLHTDELLQEVLKREGGIRTERRLSHCFLLAVSTYARPFILTDAAINIAPDLMAKRDICQNAIDLAHAMGLKEPKIAILAAVETVNPAMAATLDAAALCKMADRGQIQGAILDGPLAFDNAVDEEAVKTKGIVSPVAGRADILVVPDLEAGNMLAKQLTFMAEAEAAGVVIGARVPIILTSRADSVRTRLASCAVAVLLAQAQREGMALLKVEA